MTPPLSLPPFPFSKNAHLIVAVSGGSDSVGLLGLLASLEKPTSRWLVAAHVNYGLRGRDSLKDEARVKDLCKNWGIPCKVLRVQGFLEKAKKRKASTQELAREIRYVFFQKLTRQERAWGVAVAHHQEDQAETVLDRLLRGAGARGLSGLRVVQTLTLQQGKLQIWRPLLYYSKKQIQRYLESQGISWREDRTNRKKDYRRNQLRLEVLPFLSRWNPNLMETLARMGQVIAEEDAFLENLLKAVEKQVQSRWGKGAYTCDPQAFRRIPLALQRRWVRKVCESLAPFGRGLSFDRVEEILRLWDGTEKGPRDLGFGLIAGKRQNNAFLSWKDLRPTS